MNEWLSKRADALADGAGVDRNSLELTKDEIEKLLDLAGLAAHESGARTNAPLLCYMLGRARADAASLDQLDEIVRSTS